MRSVQQKRNGYITSTVGSSVLGTSLLGGVLTGNPLVTLGIIAGTVITSVGTIIKLTATESHRLAELNRKVTGIMLGLEQEFEKCHLKLSSIDSDCHNIHSSELTSRLLLTGETWRAQGLLTWTWSLTS